MNTKKLTFADGNLIALAIFGWVITWFGMLMIPGVEITTCTMGSDDAWLGSLILFTPVTIIGIGLTFIGGSYSSTLKWFSLPHIFLIPLAAFTAWEYLIGSTIQGMHVCSIAADPGFEGYPISWWQPYWAPAQITVILLLLFAIFKSWFNNHGKNG